MREKILGKLDRAGGNLIDMTQYTDNPPMSDDAFAIAVAFSVSILNAFVPERHQFPNTTIIRWTTTIAINFSHVRKLIEFLSTTKPFNTRIYHVHTGAHCKDGVIGTAQPAFSLFDMQDVCDANLKAGVMPINN